ncbi:MAG: hypothetical protein ABSF24_09045 [Candidatus Bathyarchaeia archaeon]
MNRSRRCEDGACEFAPSVDSRQLTSKRPADEVRYGRLWAEVELPKLLAKRVHSGGEQPTVTLQGAGNLKTK